MEDYMLQRITRKFSRYLYFTPFLFYSIFNKKLLCFGDVYSNLVLQFARIFFSFMTTAREMWRNVKSARHVVEYKNILLWNLALFLYCACHSAFILKRMFWMKCKKYYVLYDSFSVISQTQKNKILQPDIHTHPYLCLKKEQRYTIHKEKVKKRGEKNRYFCAYFTFIREQTVENDEQQKVPGQNRTNDIRVSVLNP